jgi:hypothetical protein
VALFLRFFVIAFGFFLSCFAAATTLMYTSLPTGVLQSQINDIDRVIILWSVLTATALIASIAFLPAMIGILFAEAFAWRSVLFYTIAGGIGGLVYGLTFPDGVSTDYAQRTTEITAAAGVAAGLVYWLVAGRRAGAWRGPSTKAGENI